jgi:hypothetical protein
MNDTFDLNRIQQLVESQNPSVALIVDTALLLNHPDFSTWKSSEDNVLYVFPPALQLELELLKNKPETAKSAETASQNFTALSKQGSLSDGIFCAGIGWFIAIPFPERADLEKQYEPIKFLVTAFGTIDTGRVLLTRDLMCLFPDFPVILITLRDDIYNASRFLNINSYLFKGFPMSDVDTIIKKRSLSNINWDHILNDIQSDIERKVVRIELKLSSKKCAPNWMNTSDSFNLGKSMIIAEGTGIIHAVTEIHFSWALPFIAWDFPATLSDLDRNQIRMSAEDEPFSAKPANSPIGNAHLDFGSLDHAVSPNLSIAIISRLNNCASPMAFVEDMPTVQDPISVMKQFFLLEYIFKERGFEPDSHREPLAEFENKLRDLDNLINWAFYWMHDRLTDPRELAVSLSDFLHAMRSCWSVGETISINLLDNPAGITNLKNEAEE